MIREDVRVELRSDPRLLKAVRNFVRGYLENQEVPAERVDAAVLAVDEACTNALRHACARDPESRFSVGLGSDETWLEITVRDEGEPAARGRIESRPMTAPDEQTLRPGGLGMGIIRAVFDEVEFAPGEPRGNCVTMRLRRKGMESDDASD